MAQWGIQYPQLIFDGNGHSKFCYRLDLTAASRAYIMEPQWNPMAEEQALDRIHGIGQTKPVITIRYIMRDTWEEVIYVMICDHLTDVF